jgi:carbamoyl-phosphate synthase large subunit
MEPYFTITPNLLYRAKRDGFSDRQLAEIFGVGENDVRARRKDLDIVPVFKTVETCAAEFSSEDAATFPEISKRVIH